MRRVLPLIAVLLVFVLAGCEDEDGEERSITAILIRQVIFSAKPPQTGEGGQELPQQSLRWESGAPLVGESGFVQFGPGVEALALQSRDAVTARLSFEQGADGAAYQLAVYGNDGALIAAGDAATEQTVVLAPGTYWLAIFRVSGGRAVRVVLATN